MTEARFRPSSSAHFVLQSLSTERRHGYGILKHVEEMAGRSYSYATIYDALNRLGKAGLVEDYERVLVGGRLRRYYAITPSGRAELERQTQDERARG